jgi:hypothetical protein
MKVAQLFEEYSLLRQLIIQRLARHEPVRLDFGWNMKNGYKKFTGYVAFVKDNDLHTTRADHKGEFERDHFELPADVDEKLTLRKDGVGGWLVQGV